MARKFKYNDEQFPILYENGTVQIYKNPCEEIFVKNLSSGMRIRIGTRGEGLCFTTEGLVEPFAFTNTIGWKITPRK